MISVTKKPTYLQYLNIGSNISTGHMVNVAIVRYKVCAPGSRCNGEQILDWEWRDLDSNPEVLIIC